MLFYVIFFVSSIISINCQVDPLQYDWKPVFPLPDQSAYEHPNYPNSAHYKPSYQGPSYQKPSYDKPANKEGNCLGLNVQHPIAITKMKMTDRYYKTDLDCGRSSQINRLVMVHTGAVNVTCNGVTAHANTYHSAKASMRTMTGKKTEEKMQLKPYSIIYNYSNGNIIVQECGTIANGRCIGDAFAGISIFEANEQDGCRLNGEISGATAIFKQITITGQCSAKCYLGTSSISYGAKAQKDTKEFEEAEKKELEAENRESSEDVTKETSSTP